jgi:flagella basal body P-ring formation protein FlgA
VSGSIYVDSGGKQVRVPVLASVLCPAPEVSAGAQLTVFAKIGSVRASAPAEARQPGRVGEIIRVTNRATGASLRARILNSHMAEVVP